MNETLNTENGLDKAIDSAVVTRKGQQAFNRMGWAIFIMLLAEVALPSVVILLLNLLAPAVLQNPFFSTPLVYVCMYLIGFPLMLLVLKKVPDHTPAYRDVKKKKLGLATWLALYPISFALLTAFNLIAAGVQYLLGRVNTVTTADLLTTGLPSWVYLVIGVLVAPVMEEIMFRYLTYKKLSGYGAGVYIFWSSIAFGLFHLNFGQAVYAFGLGVLFSIVMYKTGSVRYSIILHVLVNLTGGVGIGQIIMRLQNELLLNIYNYYVLALVVLGVVLGVVFIVRKFFVVKTEADEETLVNKKVAFLNPGTIIFMVACIAIIVLGFLA